MGEPPAPPCFYFTWLYNRRDSQHFPSSFSVSGVVLHVLTCPQSHSFPVSELRFAARQAGSVTLLSPELRSLCMQISFVFPGGSLGTPVNIPKVNSTSCLPEASAWPLGFQVVWLPPAWRSSACHFGPHTETITNIVVI